MRIGLSWLKNAFSTEHKVVNSLPRLPLSVEKSLHPFFNTPYISKRPKASLNQRATELENRINQIFQSMGGKEKIRLVFYPDLFPVPPPSAENHEVVMPILPLVSPNEFPLHLQVKDLNDPKLDDPKFFEQVADWIANVFSWPRSKVTWVDKQAFKLYLRFMQNPEMAKRELNFILHHELVHLLHDHKPPYVNTRSFSYKLKLFLIACAIWVYEPFGRSIEKITNSLTTKQLEREADLTAIHFTKDVEGAVYLFQTICAQNKQSRSDSEAPLGIKLFITSTGDYVPYIFSHQLQSNRIETIRREWKRLLEEKTRYGR